MKHIFPKEIYITYAVCKNCDNREFIVEGQTQVCNNCGELMFRTDSRTYIALQGKIENINVLRKSKINFPKEIIVGYAKCTNSEKGEEVVVKDIVICQECEERMIIEEEKKYFLSYKAYDCLICGDNGLYNNPYGEDGSPSFETCPKCNFIFSFYYQKEIKKYKEKWKKEHNNRYGNV